MKRMELSKISNLSDFEGTDVNNEIALYEYGFLCKQTDNDILCVVGVGTDENGYYNLFEGFSIPALEIDNIINKSWFDKKGFFACIGIDETAFLQLSNVSKLSDLISYYGYINILGSSYDPFEVINDLI